MLCGRECPWESKVAYFIMAFNKKLREREGKYLKRNNHTVIASET